MTATEILILNLGEVRRRSIKLWTGIPEKFYNWQPDQKAMNILEMVRHVLESQYAYQRIIENRGIKGEDFKSPWDERPYKNVLDEIEFAKPFSESFFEMVRTFSPDDLDQIEIIRAELGQRRKLGDYLLRIAYHEGVHAGQMLSYLRTVEIERPKVWD